MSFKKLINYTGIAVFTLAFIVYFLTAERTGSLWDCGEFILGAYKLQVVHPPGAGLFVIVGRMFTVVADMLSSDQSDIAFSINLMSSLCSALAAMLFGWVTMILGKIAIAGKDDEPTQGQNIALVFAGLASGLSAAFITSTWFSAVEGEVYAMSTFFTALTVWAAVKWYHLPDDSQSDRWLMFSIFAAALSIGVHLLSLLAFPAIAMLYYYKKYSKRTTIGVLSSIVIGGVLIGVIMKFIIAGTPNLWKSMELFCVNSLGLPINYGIIPTIIIIGGILYLLFRFAKTRNSQLLQNIAMAATLTCLAYTPVAVVVIRANADTPVNMNTPKDAMSLLPYLNREQYGERPLVKGPHYAAQPVNVKKTPRYGVVGDKYKIVDEKFDYVWKPSDQILFPRIGHQDKADLHQLWKEYLTGRGEGKPTSGGYNMKYFLSYQVNWMYWRYFMWNFSGRQNSDQGTAPWNKKDGNYITGFKSIDDSRLYNSDLAPDTIRNNPANNKYYLIPFLLGFLGLVYHFVKSRKDALAVGMLFFTTGLGIILYSNQPPIEPRERDYVLVGSFITFCIWIGFGVLALYEIIAKYAKQSGVAGAAIAGLIGLGSPYILVTQNFDDHNRSEHYASRDYAANFLNSVDKNAIIFTYGDNDTYPLWYAQEVENIRRDVRVVNLSLIQVDWYINKLRNKVNESDPIKLTISKGGYDGKSMNQVFFTETPSPQTVNYLDVLQNLEKQSKQGVEYPNLNFKSFFIPFDQSKVKNSDLFKFDSIQVLDTIKFTAPKDARYWTKDDIAILDLIASNIQDRPIYFSVTCKNDKLQGLNDYMQLEGMGLRVVPVYNKSDRSFSIYGSGKVEIEKSYKRIMEDWKWGNFDKVRTHVDKSYLAEVQAMRLTMLRTSMSLMNQGDTSRAINMVEKYFEGFPHMNFPYDGSIVPFLNVLSAAKAFEPLKKHVRILAVESKEFSDFYQSLTDDEILSFSGDIDMCAQSITDCKRLATATNDTAFDKEIKDLLGESEMKLRELSIRASGDQGQ